MRERIKLFLTQIMFIELVAIHCAKEENMPNVMF